MPNCINSLIFRWKNKRIRETLKNRVISRYQHEKGLKLRPVDIIESQITDEYHTLWLESIRRKDKINMIYNHPQLLKEDLKFLEEKDQLYLTRKFKFSAISTGVCLLIYNLGFKRKWYFYNAFNKRGNTAIRWAKKGFWIWALFQSNLATFNYFCNQQFKVDLRTEGLYQKYNLDFFFNEHVE